MELRSFGGRKELKFGVPCRSWEWIGVMVLT